MANAGISEGTGRACAAWAAVAAWTDVEILNRAQFTSNPPLCISNPALFTRDCPGFMQFCLYIPLPGFTFFALLAPVAASDD
jgi:hypothetical protein